MRHTTATLHVHPACTSNRHLIERLQAETGHLVVIHGGKARLTSTTPRTLPSKPWGGDAA